MNCSERIVICLLIFGLVQTLAAKYTLKQLDKDVYRQLREYNRIRIQQSLKPITISQDLKEIAQSVAENFAENSKLGVPDIKLEKAYVAYLFKITDKVNNKWVAEKAWFTNIRKITRIDVVNLDKDFKGYTDIDEGKLTHVAFGRAKDEYGIIYFIKLYLSDQKRDKDQDEDSEQLELVEKEEYDEKPDEDLFEDVDDDEE